MRYVITIPVRLLFFIVTRALKTVSLIASFGYRAARFAVGRPIVVFLAAIAGFLLGRQHLRGKALSDTKDKKENG